MSAVLDLKDQKTLTADELLMIPNTRFGYELVRGQLKKYMPTGFLHGLIASRIGRIIGNFADENDLGVTFAAETGFLIFQNPDTVRAPDLAFITKDKFKKHGITEKFFPGAPDLAVEVVSPSDRKKDIEEKIRDYLKAGVALVWIIYPQNKIVAVHRQNNITSILRETDELDGENVLPDFRCSLEEIFGDLAEQ